MNSIAQFLKWLNAIGPAIEGLYVLSSGDAKQALKLLKKAYSQADAKQLAAWQAKGGKRPEDETTHEHRLPGGR